MKRPLRPEELRLWSAVAATVHPLAGRAIKPQAEAAPPVRPAGEAAPSPAAPARFEISPFVVGQHAAPSRKAAAAGGGLYDIEPGRKRRISRERDPLEARIDLHGMTQDHARAALSVFLRHARDEGHRAVLVITGKGFSGDGVLRRRAPEWLADPLLRDVVAGVSEAHRRHGGEGALYVALKRKPKV